MATQRAPWLTPEEYLALDRAAEFRSEYLDGHMYFMAGASPEHIVITDNVTAEFRQRLRGTPCRSYSSEMRVKVSDSGLYAYPDLVVVCGPPHYLDGEKDVLTNPVLIVEVLSDSTERYDRGVKFHRYRQLESLREYVLVSQKTPCVEQYVRQEDGDWLYREVTDPAGAVHFPSIGCEVPLSEIYLDVEFPAGGAEAPAVVPSSEQTR